jgi:hypothetical protein
MTCSCIEQMDAKLAVHNTRLVVTFGFPRDGSPSYVRPSLHTEKIEARKRGKGVIALPSFCPFCGEAYEPQPASPAA